MSLRRPGPPDLVIALALAAAGAVLATHGAGVIGTKIADWRSFDLWFQSDAPRVFENLTLRKSDHYRSNVHPLFSLVGYGGVYLLRRFLQLDPWTAVHCFEAIVAAAWAAMLYLLLRLAGHRPADGAILTLLGLGSAAAVFWLTVPESYGLGSITLMLPLALLGAGASRRVPVGWWVVASAASLSITVTNWMSGLAAALRAFGWRRAALVSGAALVLVTAGWAVEHQLFPSTKFFVSREEQNYLRVPTPPRIARVVTAVMVHTIVLPRIDPAVRAPHWLSVQRSWPGSGGPLAVIATVAWVTLLGLGLREARRRWRTDPLVLVTLLCLAGQIGLHLVYGEETFLYALHWLPLLLVVAGFALLGPARTPALMLAGVTLALGWGHNLRRLDPAARMIRTARQEVEDQMERRPKDPWPRSAAHVILAPPSSTADTKAYLEPGGSFSPRPGSFGIALWVRDSAGGLLTTSDGMALEQIRQRFDSGSTLPPAVVIESPWYSARWDFDGVWRLRVRPTPGTQVEVVLRSVGPAGGPVDRLHWSGAHLLVNERWTLQLSPAPVAAVLGDERRRGWTMAAPLAREWRDGAGWGYARLRLAPDSTTEIAITDDSLSFAAPYRPEPVPELHLPDPAFEASLRAQVAHLLMGTVGDETRSADPLNTAVPWQRTGAYVIVALLRAGQIDRARALAERMVQEDYYGGFGAEADAPGLGIWALTEVAAALGDSGYDRHVWGAVERKAALIEEFMETRDTIHATVANRIVPRYSHRRDIMVVALPARDGLIVGRMDHGYPLLYVNAVSYLGLREAAALAARLGDRPRAAGLRQRAGALRQAWLRAYRGEELDNERTYATALWPTGVIDSGDGRARLFSALAAHRSATWDSSGAPRQPLLWTYFAIAESHQWVRLGRPETAWTTLRWFWEHQTAPGLYTWWEDKGEGNSYGLWNQVRGWVTPTTVTPHYWTSAEMLLLQLDMLAMPVAGSRGPALVLGAGIPSTWLAESLSVRGLRVRGRTIDWIWDRRRVRATVRSGPPMELRLGPAFPPGTRLELVRGSR